MAADPAAGDGGAIRAVLVEDEWLARGELRAMLQRGARPVVVVGEAESVAEGVDVVLRESPDVVFLDIHLAGDSGFRLLELVDGDFAVVFVTAYDEHALRAFEVNALDYLLKPVDEERLAKAVGRVSARRREAESDAPAPAAADERDVVRLSVEDYLFLQIDRRWRFVRLDRIACIEADGDYTRIVTGDGGLALVHKALRVWETELPPSLFQRIHRSAIINLAFVERVEEWTAYSFRVHLRTLRQPLVMSRRFAARLKRRAQ